MQLFLISVLPGVVVKSTARLTRHSCTEAGLGVDEQKIDRKPAAVDQYRHIHNQAEHEFGFHCLEQQEEGNDQDEVIREETQQLTGGIVPAWIQKTVQEVEGIPDEDTAEDDG